MTDDSKASAGEGKKKRRKPRDPFADDPFAGAEAPKAEPAKLEVDPFADVEAPKVETKKAAKADGAAPRRRSKSSRKKRVKDPFADDPFSDEGLVSDAGPVEPAELTDDPFKDVSPGSAEAAGKVSGRGGSKEKRSPPAEKRRKRSSDPFKNDPFAGAEGGVAPSAAAPLDHDPFAGVEAKAPKVSAKEKPASAAAGGEEPAPREGGEPMVSARPKATGSPVDEGAVEVSATPRAAEQPAPNAALEAQVHAKAKPDSHAEAPAQKGDVKSGAGATSSVAEDGSPTIEERASAEPKAGAAEGVTTQEGRGESPNVRATPKRARTPSDGSARPRAAEPAARRQSNSRSKPDKPVASASPKAGREKAGSEKAGSEKAGSEKAGSEKAGSEKAGSEKAGREKAGSEKAGGEKKRRSSRAPSKPKRPLIDLPEARVVDTSSGDTSISGELAPVPGRRRWPTIVAACVGVVVVVGVGVGGYLYTERERHDKALESFLATAEGLSLTDLEPKLERLPPSLRVHPKVEALVDARRTQEAEVKLRVEADALVAKLDPSAPLAEWLAGCEAALKVHPRNVAARVAKARAFAAQAIAGAKSGAALRQTVRPALQLLNEAIGLEASTADAYLARGQLLARAGELDGAKQDLKRALSLDPLSLAGRHAKGTLAILRGDWAEAALSFDSALNKEQTGAGFYGRARAELALGRPGDARVSVGRAIKADPHNDRAYELLAQICLASGSDGSPSDKKVAARKAYAEALKRNPNHAGALAGDALLGLSLAINGDLLPKDAAALRALVSMARLARDLDPRVPAAWAVVAAWSWKAGKEADARKAVNAGLALKPTGLADRWLRVTRARMSVVSGSPPEEVLQDLEALLSATPRDVYLRTLSARAYHRAGMLQDACRQISWAIDVAPNRVDFRLTRSRWLAQLEPPRLGQSLVDLNDYLKRNPDDALALSERALVYHRAELYAQAFADLQAAEAKGKRLPAAAAHRLRADHHFAEGAWQKASGAYALVLKGRDLADRSEVEARAKLCAQHLKGHRSLQ